MIEHAGSFGPSNWWARARRLSCERWARQLIRDPRATPTPTEPPTPVQTVSEFTHPTGRLLSTRHAGVELLNLLRPTIAVGRFIVFAPSPCTTIRSCGQTLPTTSRRCTA